MRDFLTESKITFFSFLQNIENWRKMEMDQKISQFIKLQQKLTFSYKNKFDIY